MINRYYPALLLITILAACGGGGGGGAVPAPGGGGAPPPTPTPTPASASGKISAASGGTVTLVTVHCGTYTFTIAPNALSADSTVTATEVYQTSVASTMIVRRHPQFTPASGNVYECGFSLDLGGALLSRAIELTASSGATSAPPGTVFNLAVSANSTWSDVGSATVNAQGGYATNLPSATLPGIMGAGQYLVYMPGSSGAVMANYGLALFGNDTNAVQVAHLYDSNGNLLSAPAITHIVYGNNGDLDGLALTPDGSMGIVTDGGKMLYFFSGTNLGNPVASSLTLDASAYGSDGDSVTIMPDGDEAVVSLDSNNSLLYLSGIRSGKPQPAQLIPLPGNREALVMSSDGKVLLARSGPYLNVFSITPVTKSTGPLGGAISHAFGNTANLTIMDKTNDDGREAMAFSPVDSSRAVVAGVGPAASLIHGLPSAPVVQSPAISGGTQAFSVAISPDGKNAFISMDKGIAVFGGVDTATMTQTQMYTVPLGAKDTLWEIESIGVTLDGKYLVALGLSTNTGQAYMVVLPIVGGQLGPPATSPTPITMPYIDGMVMH